MSRSAEVQEFLTTRRARVKPQDVGMGGYEPRRRVVGLRREEVAALAGVSVDYYVRLERGDLVGVSETVLESLARALRLTADEHRHLFDLARVANAPRSARWDRSSDSVRPTVRRMLDQFSSPAWVRNDRLDLLAANPLATALYSPLFEGAIAAPNKARFVFLDQRARDFYPDWTSVARDNVAVLRAAAGGSPYDKRLSDLVGELSTRSEEFRSIWAEHDVLTHQAGATRINHPLVGVIELSYEAMQLSADTGLAVIVYGVEPGTASAERLQLLSAWTAGTGAGDVASALEGEPQR